MNCFMSSFFCGPYLSSDNGESVFPDLCLCVFDQV